MPRKEIVRSHKLDNVKYEIRGPLTAAAAKMELEGHEIIKLNIGNPGQYGFNAPDEVILDMIYNLRSAQAYSDSKGIFSARKAIMQYYQLKKFDNVSIDDIYIGNGVSEMIIMSMQALLDHGDEILVPSPDYPLWTAAVNLAGGTAVHYLCDEASEWMPDLDDIRRKITKNTRGIVIINPNNPTGAIYSREILEGICQIARENDLVIFSDEIYEQLVMDSYPTYNIGAMAPDLLVVTLNGLSKSHRIAGFRAGWIVLSGDKSHARDYINGINLLASLRLCANVPTQYVIQTAIGGYQSVDELVMPGGRIYEQRNLIYEGLASLPGVRVMKPKAGLYIFPSLDPELYHITDDDRFAMDLLQQEKVLIVPGSGFNWPKPGYFRIVYLAELKELERAVRRIGRFLETYRQ